MTDLPPLDDVKKLVLDEVRVMERDELTGTREVCASGLAGKAKARFEKKHGKGSFPPVDEYCTAVLERTVEKKVTPGLYINLAVQQMGIGREFDFGEMGPIIGDKPLQIHRNVRAAAEAGATTYMDAAGKERPLLCPLALDAGVTWGSANPDKVDRPALTDAQLTKIAQACFDPNITEVTIGATNQTMPIQKIGLIVGELLGKKYKITLDTATTGAISPQEAVPQPAARPAIAKDKQPKATLGIGG